MTLPYQIRHSSNSFLSALIALILVGSSFSCSSEINDLEERQQFNDRTIKERFVSKLKEKGINFYTSEDNYVVYKYKDKILVESIVNEIMGAIVKDKISFSKEDQKYAQQFKNMLNELNIKYSEDVREYRVYFAWDDGFDELVNTRLEEFNRSMKEQKIKEFTENQK